MIQCRPDRESKCLRHRKGRAVSDKGDRAEMLKDKPDDLLQILGVQPQGRKKERETKEE